MNTPKRYRRKASAIDKLIPRNGDTVEAMQLIGRPVETMAVCEWIRDNGYPWLLGNATQPETLVPEGGGKVGDPGIYIDPSTGKLVVRSRSSHEYGSYGEWFLHFSDGSFRAYSQEMFGALYEPLED